MSSPRTCSTVDRSQVQLAAAVISVLLVNVCPVAGCIGAIASSTNDAAVTIDRIAGRLITGGILWGRSFAAQPVGGPGPVWLIDIGEDGARLHDLTRADREVGDLAVAHGGDVVLHLHRLQDADDLARLRSPGPSRRGPSRSCPASARGSRRGRARRGEPPCAAGAFGATSRRSSKIRTGTRRPSTSTRMSAGAPACGAGERAGVDLGGQIRVGRAPARARSSCGAERELLGPGSIGGPGSWWARLRRRTRPRARSIRRRACSRSAPRHDQLGEHRVVVAGDLAAFGHARVDPDEGAARLPVAGDPARARQEVAAGILRVDPALDRVAARLGLEVERLAHRDPQLQRHEVEAGDHLRHGVLHLQAGVHLQEVEGAVLVDDALDRAGVDVAGLARQRRSRPRRTASRIASSITGTGVSSISFWWRRWTEQSRSPRNRTVPCVSAMICAST